MITIKEYAAQKGVSHQAVYKQLQTHAKELEEHIVTQGRTRYLTEEAVAILEQYRETNIQVLERTNDRELIDELKQNIEMLLQEKASLSMELAASYKKQSEQATLIAQAEASQKLLEVQQEDIRSLRETLDDLKENKEQLQKDLEVQKAEAERVAEELEEARKQKEELKAEIEAERSRKLSWKERLFGKKGE